MCYPQKRGPKDCKTMPLWRQESGRISMPILRHIAERLRAIPYEFASYSTLPKNEAWG